MKFLVGLFIIPVIIGMPTKSLNVQLSEDIVKIAVLDTGFGYKQKNFNIKLCSMGHRDFTSDQRFMTDDDSNISVPRDEHGHGTNVAGLIDFYAKKSDTSYCIVIIKILNGDTNLSINLSISEKAIKYVLDEGFDVINYSAGGPDSSPIEKKLIKNFLDKGGIFVAAAGNEGIDIGPKYLYYPAMYDKRIVVVGSISESGSISKYSNRGNPVNAWERGDNREILGIKFSGTSQATAIVTGKIVGLMKYRYKNID
jgi:subtilisin family serine protease